MNWSPAADRLAYITYRNQSAQLYTFQGTKPVLISNSVQPWSHFSWANSGRIIAYADKTMPNYAFISTVDGIEQYTVPIIGKGVVRKLAWSPDDRYILVSASESGDQFVALYLISVSDRKVKNKVLVPGDIATFQWGDDGTSFLFSADYAGSSTLYLGRPDGTSIRQGLLPPGLYSIQARSLNSKRIMVKVEELCNPPSIWALHLDRGKVDSCEPLYLQQTNLPSTCPEPIEFQGPTNQPVHAYLWRAGGVSQQSAVIVSIHGGPHLHEAPVWNPRIQMYVDKGFHYLAVNYSGSTGYGAKYQAGGSLAVRVAEIAAAIEWACDSLEVPTSRTVLVAGSYGTRIALGVMSKLQKPLGAAILVSSAPAQRLPMSSKRPRKLYVFAGANDSTGMHSTVKSAFEMAYGDSIFHPGNGNFQILEKEGHTFHRLSSHALVDSAILHSID